MLARSFLQRFKKLDAYAKTLDDFRIRTATGAAVTMVSSLVITLLVLFEISRYMTPVMDPQIIVDGGKMEKLPIAFDIKFPHLPCYLLSLDVMDESGDHQSDYSHDVFKVRIDDEGNEIEREKAAELSSKTKPAANQPAQDYCGPCYGAARQDGDQCCNTCEEAQKAYSDMGWIPKPEEFEQCIREGWTREREMQNKEGCRMHGHLLVNKMRGNIHFSPGRSYSHGTVHSHDVRSYLATNHNFKHEIESLQFGSQNHEAQKQKRTKSKSLSNPLDKTTWGIMDGAMMYQYFLNIVPTQFDYLNGKSLRTFQYSVSRQERNLRERLGDGLPGVFFMMDFSPMLVMYSEKRPSLASFMTSLCAIVGGIFTVASMVDGLLYRAERQFQQKVAMGKAL